MKKLFQALLFLFITLTISSCSQESGSDNATMQNNAVKVRWYDDGQVKQGNVLYQKNCSSCHKKDASGHGNIAEEGTAPALNGSEHTWHHPMKNLVQTVKNGGVALGGTMPAFKEKLTDKEIVLIIAWLQSHWPDKQYNLWNKRNNQNK